MFEFLLVLSAYLIGAIPFGLLIGNLYGKNLQSLGSRNIGATNATRVLGKKIGAVVLLLDFFKSFLPVLLAKEHFGELFAVIIGAAAVVGHIFPVYLKFNGGKGVATMLGLYCGLDYFSGFFFALNWVIWFKLFKYSSFASIFAVISSLIRIYFEYYDFYITLVFSMLSMLIIFKHKSNIEQLFFSVHNK